MAAIFKRPQGHSHCWRLSQACVFSSDGLPHVFCPSQWALSLECVWMVLQDLGEQIHPCTQHCSPEQLVQHWSPVCSYLRSYTLNNTAIFLSEDVLHIWVHYFIPTVITLQVNLIVHVLISKSCIQFPKTITTRDFGKQFLEVTFPKYQLQSSLMHDEHLVSSS